MRDQVVGSDRSCQHVARAETASNNSLRVTDCPGI